MPTALVSTFEWTSTEGITAIATCLVALFTFLTLFSLILLRKQIISDHDRSRREMAVDLMKCYSTTYDPTNRETVFGFALLQLFSKEQCHSLWNREVFSVENKHQHLLESWRAAHKPVLDSKGTKKEVGPSTSSLMLSLEEVYLLRSLATTRLNKLEMIAGAWYHHVADRKIIEQEFLRIFRPKDGKYILEDFRKASGVYPSIAQLCNNLELKNDESFVAKPEIGR